jgi:predicted RNase H-like HicB family nuclease
MRHSRCEHLMLGMRCAVRTQCLLGQSRNTEENRLDSGAMQEKWQRGFSVEVRKNGHLKAAPHVLNEQGLKWPWSPTMHLQLTAVFRKVPEGYIGFVEELPGANTQGATLEETRANLREAVALVIEANRTLAAEDAGPDVIREPLTLA